MWQLPMASFVVAQALPADHPLLNKLIRLLQISRIGTWDLLSILSAAALFAGACYLVRTRQPAGAFAAYLVLLPIPVFFSIFGILKGHISSLTVMAATPDLKVTTQDIAGAYAASLTGLLVAIVVSIPSYLVIAYGLLSRTLTSPPKSTAVLPQPLLPQEPIISLNGPKSVIG